MRHAQDQHCLRFFGRVGLIYVSAFGALSAIASLLVGGVLWRDVLIGAVLGLTAGAIRVIEVARLELCEVMYSMVESVIVSASTVDPAELEALALQALERTREQLRGRNFKTLALGAELSEDSLRASFRSR